MEPGSAPLLRSGGALVKKDPKRFHRFSSTERFGGPGTTLTISYRARATAIRDRAGSSIVEGAKVGLRFPVSSATSGLSEDDPRSAYGTVSQGDPTGPGSYTFVSGLTEGGYVELSRNGYGATGYDFFANERLGYSPGTWRDVTVTVEWLATARDGIRVRYWHGENTSGEPIYDVTDAGSPFWHAPGYLWLRTDDTDVEYDYIRVFES